MVSSQWPIASGQRSVVSGQWSVVSGHWSREMMSENKRALLRQYKQYCYAKGALWLNRLSLSLSLSLYLSLISLTPTHSLSFSFIVLSLLSTQIFFTLPACYVLFITITANCIKRTVLRHTFILISGKTHFIQQSLALSR